MAVATPLITPSHFRLENHNSLHMSPSQEGRKVESVAETELD